MNEPLKIYNKIIPTDTSGRWVAIEDVTTLAHTLVQDSIKVVKSTPTTCAYTTYDLNVVECTVNRSVEKLKTHFGV
jgi:hypothetical protein